MTYEIDRPALFAAFRELNHHLTQSQVDGINFLVDRTVRPADLPPNQLGYCLATSWWETGTLMQPCHEKGGAAYFLKYEPGTKLGKRLGNVHKGDGLKYAGRGFPQITGLGNYTKMMKRLGVDFVGNPDLALVPQHAAAIMYTAMPEGLFTGAKLGTFFHAGHEDPMRARTVVNGKDRAAEIAAIYKVVRAGLPK